MQVTKLNKSSKVNQIQFLTLIDWCSKKLSLKKPNKQHEKKFFLNYVQWLNYFNIFNKICLNSLNSNFIYINFEKYNYNFVEYIYLYLYKDNITKLSILDFCSAIGIFIPHYCYHPDLSIAGNCRMCLIQIDGSMKPIASCALSITNKMIINTQSIFVKKAQEVLWNFYY